MASNLRQLIEQQFQIMLSEDQKFSVHQIVWAKVQQYPTWPAKIVRKLKQHHKTVYKIHFFGDPSYCYLHESSLTSYSVIQLNDISFQTADFKLKKAIELANVCYSKQLEKQSQIHTQLSPVVIDVPIFHSIYEESLSTQKDHIDLPQKNKFIEEKNTTQNQILQPFTSYLSPLNVIEVLESYQISKNNDVQRNLKRKQIICFQTELKQNLLLKYKLNNVDNLKQTSKQQNIIYKPLKQLRMLKKQQKNSKIIKFNIKQVCQRKLYKILLLKGLLPQLSIKLTKKVLSQIEIHSFGFNSQCSLSFKENFVRSVYQICTKIHLINEAQFQYIEKKIMSIVEMNFNKIQNQDGSRTTSLQTETLIFA